MVCLITRKTMVIITAAQAAVASTPRHWMPRNRAPWPYSSPSLVEKKPVRMVPIAPHTPWTEMAPTGSSIFSTESKKFTETGSTSPAAMPMAAAPAGDTASHPAVMATRPARAALRVMPTSGFL